MDKRETDECVLRLVTLAFAEDTAGMVQEVKDLDRRDLLGLVEALTYLATATYGNLSTQMGMERMELWRGFCTAMD
jgi:hypothetical protein